MKLKEKLKKYMKGNILIDLRNAIYPDGFRNSGFNLIQLGRSKKRAFISLSRND